jgi:helix-turn-helix protein
LPHEADRTAGGSTLRTIRVLDGSMKLLAGTSFAYISDMERGVKVPSLTIVIRLAVALECKVMDLVGGQKESSIAREEVARRPSLFTLGER